MKALFQKIKSLYALINRGILKVSDWMIGGFRVALVFGVVCDGSKEEVMLGHTLLCLIMINGSPRLVIAN